MSSQKPQQPNVQMNFNKEVQTAVGNVEGDMYVNPKQSLSESALEIQKLLNTLESSYGKKLSIEKQEQVDFAIKQIENDLTLRNRVVGAFKSGGLEALKEIMDNPYVNILVAAYEGFQEPQ